MTHNSRSHAAVARLPRMSAGLLAAAALAAALAVFATGVAPARAHEVGGSAAVSFGATRPLSARGHTASETPAQILRFWTRDRLANAKPFPLPRGAASTPVGRQARRPVAGPSLRVPGSQPGPGGVRRIRPLASATHAEPSPWWDSDWGRWPTVGRLYSYHPQKGYLGWCSGTVIPSQNASTIWTAGHCLASGGYWHTKLLFVPGQNGPGDEPYGSWPIRFIDTSAAWLARNDCEVRKVSCPWGADYGAAVAYTKNGTTLARYVGSTGIWFGKGLKGVGVRALGYPSDPPYFQDYAGYLFYCDSAPSSYQLDVAGYYFAPKACGMTGGASGGPWLYADSYSWYLVSNNSSANTRDAYGNFVMPTFMNGPYLDGTTAKGLYNYIQAK